jgi:L-lysine 2,3-aminomutase
MKILYRGPLSSCNYACHYCPFAKAKESRESLKRDKQALSRLGDWVRGQEQPIGILFTPWGEALIRRWYQKAIIDLSLMPHVEKVAIFSGSHAPAWEPSRDAPASRVDNDDAGASIPHSHASAWER